MILASLPVLLELSLFLFFAGLELLWTRHHVPFAIVLSVVGLAVLIYGITTLLPGHYNPPSSGHLVMPTVFHDWSAPSESSLDSLEHPTSYHHEDHLFDDCAPAHITSLTSQILYFHQFLATRKDWDRSDMIVVKGLWSYICKVPGNSKLIGTFFHPEILFV
ncbi:hypothetical protein L218DRAFT_1006135 [Marasmius fiardii PR-910]|nr:hypothetical protein L218DRAFT_1006135 [Marasmius fiardii PR-910]